MSGELLRGTDERRSAAGWRPRGARHVLRSRPDGAAPHAGHAAPTADLGWETDSGAVLLRAERCCFEPSGTRPRSPGFPLRLIRRIEARLAHQASAPRERDPKHRTRLRRQAPRCPQKLHRGWIERCPDHWLSAVTTVDQGTVAVHSAVQQRSTVLGRSLLRRPREHCAWPGSGRALKDAQAPRGLSFMVRADLRGAERRLVPLSDVEKLTGPAPVEKPVSLNEKPRISTLLGAAWLCSVIRGAGASKQVTALGQT